MIRLSHAEALKAQNLLSVSDFIRLISSPWPSHMDLVKIDRTKLLCVDFQALDDTTIKKKYPLPRY